MRPLFALLAFQLAAAAQSPPPPPPAGTAAQFRLTKSTNLLTAAGPMNFRVSPGRFIPFEHKEGKAVSFAGVEPAAFRVLILKPGERLYNQVRNDEPAGAEPSDYNFPDAKGPVYIVLARSTAAGAAFRIEPFVNAVDPIPPQSLGVINVEITGEPIPTPIPPNPGPGPGPTGNKLMVVVVDDKTSWPAQRAAVVGSKTLSAALVGAGHRYEVLDLQGSAVQQLGLMPYLTPRAAGDGRPTAGGSPALILMDLDGPQRGLVRAAVKCPETEAGILAAVKAVSTR